MAKKANKEDKLETIRTFILDAGSDDIPTFGGSYTGGAHCQQVADELASCILLILESGESIESYLEIGAAAGGSVFILNRYFSFKQIVVVDDNRHPKAVLRPLVLRDIEHQEVIGDSQDEAVRESLRSMEVSFDLLMIDGDHSYDGVKSDVETYGRLVRTGGYMIFHDSRVFGPAKVFEELKDDRRWEFIREFTSKNGPVCGIGLFRKAADED